MTGNVSIFDHDDAGYLSRLAADPDGFVLNCGRPASASYLPLHRASCRRINGTPANGAHWTISYRKVCSPSRLELETWAQQNTGASPSPCLVCCP
jgi:hypothetical protein